MNVTQQYEYEEMVTIAKGFTMECVQGSIGFFFIHMFVCWLVERTHRE